MGTKDTLFSMRLSKKLLDEYRKFCEENSINVSKRLRKFMERDLEMWRIKKEANKKEANKKDPN